MMRALKARRRRLHFNPGSCSESFSRMLSVAGDALQETSSGIWALNRLESRKMENC